MTSILNKLNPVSKYKLEIDRYRKANNVLADEVSSMHKLYDRLLSENGELKAVYDIQVSKLEKQIQDQEATITTLQGKIIDLETKNEDLIQQYKPIAKRLKKLQDKEEIGSTDKRPIDDHSD